MGLRHRLMDSTQNLIARATGLHTALPQHHDLIRNRQYLGPVRYQHQTGSARLSLRQRILQQGVPGFVHVGVGLVKNQQSGLAIQSPRQPDPLANAP